MQLPRAAPLAIWPPLLAVAGPGEASEAHRHHNLHLLLAREGTLRARIDGQVRRAAGVLTKADVEHAIDAAGLEVVILFIDPESIPGASLSAACPGPAMYFAADTRAALLAALPAQPDSLELDAWAHATLTTLTKGAWTRPRMHPLVRRLLVELRQQAELELSLEALAARVGLSPSRLMHVFTESVGIPLRPYLRWLRVQRAATAIVHGAPLAAAALDAGFSDAAHMSRSFKQMFGLAPSALQRRSRSAE